MLYILNNDTDRYGQPLLQEPEQEKWGDVNDLFDFSKISCGTQQSYESGDTEQQENGTDGDTLSGSNIGAAIAEVLLQPHVVPASGGGGGASGGWRDDDEKNKNKYRPRRKGR